MKRRLLSLALAAAASSALLIAAPASAESDAKQEVIDTTRQWIVAENRHDAASLREILDDNFITTYAAGKPGNKESFIKAITSGEVDPTQTQDLTDTSVIVDGDTAIIVGNDTFHSATKPPVAPLRFTITYVKRQGRWRALAEHIVSIPGKQ